MAKFTVTLDTPILANAITCVEQQLQSLGGTTKYDGEDKITATGVNWGTDQKSLNNLKARLNDRCTNSNDDNPPVATVTSP